MKRLLVLFGACCMTVSGTCNIISCQDKTTVETKIDKAIVQNDKLTITVTFNQTIDPADIINENFHVILTSEQNDKTKELNIIKRVNVDGKDDKVVIVTLNQKQASALSVWFKDANPIAASEAPDAPDIQSANYKKGDSRTVEIKFNVEIDATTIRSRNFTVNRESRPDESIGFINVTPVGDGSKTALASLKLSEEYTERIYIQFNDGNHQLINPFRQDLNELKTIWSNRQIDYSKDDINKKEAGSIISDQIDATIHRDIDDVAWKNYVNGEDIHTYLYKSNDGQQLTAQDIKNWIVGSEKIWFKLEATQLNNRFLGNTGILSLTVNVH